MPMYCVLGNLTDQGVKNIKELRQRVEQNRASGERLGTKVHGWYLAMGSYDMVVIAEAPDDETMAAQVMTVAGRGNNRTETLRLFTLDEAEKIIEKMG